MGRAILALLLAAATVPAFACRKLGTQDLDAVRALRARALPQFRPPADGVLTDAQLDAYVKQRRATGSAGATRTAAVGADPAEMAWVRARVDEALLALEAKQVTEAAFESYGAAIARLRETRRAERDARVAARLDAEIAGLERERATLRKADAGAGAAAARNAERVAPRRAELAALGL